MAPDVTLTVVESISRPRRRRPRGDDRIQPTSQPTIQGKTGEVGGQVWTNSEDLFAATITDTFTGGTYTALGTSLVYGVSYSAVAYGVDGYQPGTATFQAGITGSTNLPITPLATTPLPPPVLVSTSGTCHTNDAPVSTTTPIATVTLTFNVPVATGRRPRRRARGAGQRRLRRHLGRLLDAEDQRLGDRAGAGTSLVFSGDTMTIGWTPSVGLASPGTTDIVEQVEYPA